MLKESSLQELRKILKEDYGLDISLEESTEIARVLLNYYGLLAKIDAREINLEPKNDEPKSD